MAGVNRIIARKLAATRLASGYSRNPVHELSGIESDVLLRDIALRRCCLQKKCLCLAHLSQMMKERKIGVSG